MREQMTGYLVSQEKPILLLDIISHSCQGNVCFSPFCPSIMHEIGVKDCVIAVWSEAVTLSLTLVHIDWFSRSCSAQDRPNTAAGELAWCLRFEVLPVKWVCELTVQSESEMSFILLCRSPNILTIAQCNGAFNKSVYYIHQWLFLCELMITQPVKQGW